MIPLDELCIDDYFKPGGLISQVKPGFTQRPGQPDLSKIILNTMDYDGDHVVAEGPCGYGKSFAILVPAIIRALKFKKRIVVSTETLALQDQYITLDLPLLLAATAIAGHNFTFAVAKGKGNYACLNKIEVDDAGRYKDLTPLKQWALKQRVGVDSGDLASVPEHIMSTSSDWYDVAGDDECERRACPFYGNGALIGGQTGCFIYQARKNHMGAQIVVTNHTLLLLDRQHIADDDVAGPLLGEFDTLIVDEGHTLAEKAQATWGYEFGPRTLSSAMRSTNKMLRRAGIDAFEEGYLDKWKKLEDEIFLPFKEYIGQTLPFSKVKDGCISMSKEVAEIALSEMEALYKNITKEAKYGDPMKAEDAAETAKEKLSRYHRALQSVYMGDASDKADDDAMKDNWLSYIETQEHNGRDGYSQRYIKLAVKPIEVGPLMAVKLFKTIPTVVVASATLRIQKNFRFIRKEMGMPAGDLTREFVGESPFDFEKAVKGYFPKDLAWPPDRKSVDYERELAVYNREMADRIEKLIALTGGGALVLFTSLQSMKEIYLMVRARVDVSVMCQGDASKNALVARMKSDEDSCLFATKSFFTGVDIPGNGLRLLIIMRAPFKVPSDPMFGARCDRLKAKGRDPFKELSMPLMLMDIQQGFGRLIRSEKDTGIFALLDSRANARGYGSDIIAALPKIGRVVLEGDRESRPEPELEDY